MQENNEEGLLSCPETSGQLPLLKEINSPNRWGTLDKTVRDFLHPGVAAVIRRWKKC
jgi:hypothetical protein